MQQNHYMHFHYNLFSLGKVQSLRSTFREEMRKVKKSQGTGSGANEVYESQWKFFGQCKFLEDVIISSKPTFSNQPTSTLDAEADCDDTITINEVVESKISNHPKRRRNSKAWMETAANALADIANNKDEEDEWNVFGRDVANSLRSIENTFVQRQVKFAIQTAIFQASSQPEEPSRPLMPMQHNYYGDHSQQYTY